MNLETKVIWTHVKNGLNLDLKKFFGDWNLQYQQEIIVVYQNMQNEKKLINKSQYNEFGDKQVQFEVDPPILNLELMWIQTNAIWVNLTHGNQSYRIGGSLFYP